MRRSGNRARNLLSGGQSVLGRADGLPAAARGAARSTTEMVTQRARAALAAVLTAGLSLASVRPLAAPPGRSSADFAEAARIGDLLAAWRFPEAAERARALVTAAERSDGADSLAAAEALDLLVKALVGSWAVRDGQALALAGRALAIKEARLPADDARLVASLRNLGMVRLEMSDYRGAVPLLRRALALAEQAWGETHPDTLVLALELLEAEAYSVGTTWGNERAEQIDARIASALGADHPLRLRSQFFLFTHTIDIAAALARAEREYGPHSPGLADARFYAFLSRAQQGNDRKALAEALEIATRAREDFARLLGPEHPRFADALSYSAQVLWFGGRFEEGLAFEEQAAAIWHSTMGEEHVFSAIELANLGIYRSSVGDDIGAREIYPLALERLERQLGSEHAWVSLCKMYLGKLLAREGDVVEAERWLRRAVIGYRSSPHPHRGNTAIAETELAGLLVEKGALEEAALLLSRAEALIRAWDEIHTVGLLEVTLARLHLAQGDEGAARGDLLRLLDFLERKEMLDHPSAAEALALLARLDQISGRPADAVPRSRRALDLRERVLGPNHPLVAESLVQLAELKLAAGDPAAALADAVRGEEVSRRHLELWSRALGDSEVMLYVARRVSGVDLALSAARRGDPRQIAAAWDALVRSRALVLDQLARRQAIVHGAEDPAVARGVAAVERARAQLARLLVRGPEGEEPARYEDRLDYVRRQRESAEAALARVSEEALRDLDFPTAGFEEVRAALPADAGLVAFHRQAASTAGGSPARYFAFVLAGPASAPELVELPPAAEIEARVAALHAEIARAARDPRRAAALEPSFRAAAAELRRQVWDPLASRFAHVRRVFVVPAGSLVSVPFAALPDDGTGYLLEVGPEIHFLSAERDLAAGSPARPGAGLLALGAPDFDAPPD
ncbi:MAG: tetratricopeptide repeat protein, partial [Thermoanaerobaculia bacterium]